MRVAPGGSSSPNPNWSASSSAPAAVRTYMAPLEFSKYSTIIAGVWAKAVPAAANRRMTSNGIDSLFIASSLGQNSLIELSIPDWITHGLGVAAGS